MKQTVDRCDFVRAFKNYGREADFSQWGLNQLWEYFEEYEQGSGEEIELDVIGICCEFNESTWGEFKSDYPDFADIDDTEVLAERVSEHTSVVSWTDDKILYMAF
jgi:hypothetical protein